MEAQMVSKTLGFYPQLTWLFALEKFIEFSRHEGFKSNRNIAKNYVRPVKVYRGEYLLCLRVTQFISALSLKISFKVGNL
jgi:hypothetical protein